MDITQLLFSFSGRVNRQPYWLVGIGVSFASGLMSGIASVILSDALLAIGYVGVGIASVWIGLALSVKRAHDRGRSGLFVLLFLIPLVNLWPMVELYFLRGTSGQNEYGPDPVGSV